MEFDRFEGTTLLMDTSAHKAFTSSLCAPRSASHLTLRRHTESPLQRHIVSTLFFSLNTLFSHRHIRDSAFEPSSLICSYRLSDITRSLPANDLFFDALSRCLTSCHGVIDRFSDVIFGRFIARSLLLRR